MDIRLREGKQLFGTQLEDLKIICKEPRWCNFSEMGAGKTLPHALLAKGVIDDNLCDMALIITPKGVLGDWHAVYKDFIPCELNKLVTLYHAPGIVRQHMTLRPIVIMSWDTFQQDAEKFIEIARSKRIMVVADEAHKVRNTTSSTFKKLDQLSRLAYRLYPLTGTPLPNGVMNAFAYIHLVAPGKYYKDAHSFKRRHVKTSPYDKHVTIGVRDEERVNKILDSMSTRHRMDDVMELPPVINRERPVDWIPEQLDAYITMMEDGLLELDDRFIQADGSLALLIRLHQILCHPEMLGLSFSSPKWEALYEDLESIGLAEHKIVIWAHYRQTVERLANELARWNPAVAYGGTKDLEAEKTKFREDPTCRVIIANALSLGVGTNLTTAHYMAFFEYTYDLDNYDQAISRCRRPGQTQKLSVLNYAMRGSMEQLKMLPRLIAKKAFSARMLNDKNALRDFIALAPEIHNNIAF